jgi:hypothetical protein
MHDFSQPSQPAAAAVAQTGIRSRFLWERSEWERYQQGKMGKTMSEKKDCIAITRTETWAKASQNVKQNHRHHFNAGHTNKKNTTMSMKKSIEANTKLNMNMNMQVKMKIMMNMNVNVKRNMNMNMKTNMNENLNEYEFGYDCHDACKEECGLLTRP